MGIKIIQCFKHGFSISAQATNALVKIECRHYCWLCWYLLLYRLQHGDVWTYVGSCKRVQMGDSDGDSDGAAVGERLQKILV